MAFSWTTKKFPAGNPFSAACTKSIGLLTVDMHALVSPLYYTTHHICTLLVTSFTHNTLLTWSRSLERGCSFLNLHAAVPSPCSKDTRFKGIRNKSLLTKIPFQKIPKPSPIANYYSTSSRDDVRSNRLYLRDFVFFGLGIALSLPDTPCLTSIVCGIAV